MAGSTMDTEPQDWATELEAFASRNDGRPTQMEVDDHVHGAQRQLSGYALTGATYDRRDDRIALMFGGGGSGEPHATHTIGGVQSVCIAGIGAQDHVLCIDSDDGRAILTFIDR